MIPFLATLVVWFLLALALLAESARRGRTFVLVAAAILISVTTYAATGLAGGARQEDRLRSPPPVEPPSFSEARP